MPRPNEYVVSHQLQRKLHAAKRTKVVGKPVKLVSPCTLAKISIRFNVSSLIGIIALMYKYF